jgi:glycosyltransferase involved in cell wall biosynthesis
MTAERPYAVMVTGCDPLDGGGASLVTHGRIQSLYRLGYDVGLLRDSRKPLDARALAELCRVVERPPLGWRWLGKLLWNMRRLLEVGILPRWNEGTWLALRREVDRHQPKLVILDTVRTVEYGALLRRRGYGGRILIHEHNVEYELLARQRTHTKARGKRLELWWRIRRLRYVESMLSQYGDACLALSTVDRDHLARLNPGLPCTLLPHAVDMKHYAPAGALPKTPELLFIGSSHWAPNRDGLRWFVEEMWPQVRAQVPDARLTVVGRGPPDWLHSIPGVSAEGYVDDERPYYARARVVIVPLRFGSGVRIKILNALAMERPVVSTPLGAEGIPIVDGESIEIAETPGTFVERTVRLLKDDAHAEAVSRAGYALCRNWYSAESVDQRLREAIGGPAAPMLKAASQS